MILCSSAIVRGLRPNKEEKKNSIFAKAHF